jgi:hypothetical protein
MKMNADGALNGTIPSPDTLQQKTAQCLLLGRYRVANAYALEALLLYIQSGFLGDMKTGLPAMVRHGSHTEVSVPHGLPP